MPLAARRAGGRKRRGKDDFYNYSCSILCCNHRFFGGNNLYGKTVLRMDERQCRNFLHERKTVRGLGKLLTGFLFVLLTIKYILIIIKRTTHM